MPYLSVRPSASKVPTNPPVTEEHECSDTQGQVHYIQVHDGDDLQNGRDPRRPLGSPFPKQGSAGDDTEHTRHKVVVSTRPDEADTGPECQPQRPHQCPDTAHQCH